RLPSDHLDDRSRDLARRDARAFVGIRLPRRLRGLRPLAARSRRPPGINHRRGVATILICDDEPTLRELMRTALDGDHSFIEARDGREALELARRARPDVVLLDLMMPGATGLDALAEIRGDPELRATPVVIVSAFSGETERRDAVEAGA